MDPANVTLVTEEKVTKVKVASFVKEGTVTLTLMSKDSGNTASIVLDVQKAPGQIANVTVLDPEVTVAAGSKGYVGLEVTDMYGTVLAAKDYAAGLEMVSSNPAVVANVTPVSTIVVVTTGDNAGKIEVPVVSGAAKDATATISINSGGKQVASFIVKAGVTAAPTTIEVKADSKHKTTLANGADTTIVFEAKDQYGNKLSSASGDYEVLFAVKDKAENINIAGQDADKKATEANETNASIAVSAAKTGSAVLVAQLIDKTDALNPVVLDSKEITFTVVANESTAGISVSDIPTLYKTGTAGTGAEYQEDVKVETEDGIALPTSSIISVTSDHDAVLVKGSAGNYTVEGVAANLDTKDGNPVDTTATLTVIYNADDKPVTLTKDVTVSAADLKAAAILTVDTQQDAGSAIVTKLADNTEAVTTIDVDDFTALGTKADVFTIVQDNFERYVNAKTGATDYNTVTLTIGNADGFVAGTTPDVLDLNANGSIDFATLGDNLIENDADGASFRILITAGGQVQAVNVNVAGGDTVAQAAVAAAKAALTTLSFDATNGADHATAPILVKPANHANGSTHTLAVSDVTGAGLTASVNVDGGIDITRGTASGSFKVTVTIQNGTATDTKVFTVTVPEVGAGTLDVTIS